MQLHTISSANKKSKKRIGRGGKRGTFSGRGTKGQKSRAGHRIRPAIRDLILRLPKRRGYKNRPKSEKPFIVSLSELEAKLKLLSGEKKMLHGEQSRTIEIDRAFLKELGILPASYIGAVKILAGKIEMPISVKGIKISKSAKEKVEKAGGNVIADKRGLNADQRGISTDKNKKLPRKSARSQRKSAPLR